MPASASVMVRAAVSSCPSWNWKRNASIASASLRQRVSPAVANRAAASASAEAPAGSSRSDASTARATSARPRASTSPGAASRSTPAASVSMAS